MGAATDPIVVGHSLSGNVLPLVARRAPVRHAVYLCAMIPDPGRSQSDQERAGGMTDPAYLKGLRRTDGCTVWADADLARELLYQDCAADVAAAAVARLRPQAYGPPTEVWPSGPLPAVPATAIVCAEDRILHPDWSRRVAPERLTAAVLELPGGHSPFLSRPAELAEALHGPADTRGAPTCVRTPVRYRGQRSTDEFCRRAVLTSQPTDRNPVNHDYWRGTIMAQAPDREGPRTGDGPDREELRQRLGDAPRRRGPPADLDHPHRIDRPGCGAGHRRSAPRPRHRDLRPGVLG